MLTSTDLAFARSAQESIMFSTVEVYAYAEGWDVVDGVDVPRRGPLVYSGKARLQRSGLGDARSTAGAVPVSESAYVGAVPWDVDLAAGMTLTVTASDDPHVAGLWFRIAGVEFNALALTARRFTAELVTDRRPQT